MALLLGQDSIFGQLLNFTPHPLVQAMLDGGSEAEDDQDLTVTRDFGANPGNLRMLSFRPAGLPDGAPLVVVLHGCKQTAGAYDRGAGWSQLAQEFGFAVLLPEQRRLNNPQGCFNWFQPEDVSRDEGEVASIASMIRFLLREERLDAGRVFITGLSAGGGLTAAMLATYPELFAGGAIIAGLPFGSANGVHEAFGAMGQGRIRPARELGDRVRAASRHHGPWPTVSIWQGEADTTVNPVNATELVKQWTDVQGIDGQAPEQSMIGPVSHQVWRNGKGQMAVELYRIPGFGHATPIDPMARPAVARCGSVTASRYILPAGISSTYRIAESWGLTGEGLSRRRDSAWDKGPGTPFGGHQLWQNLMPGGMTVLKEMTAELTAPDTVLGRVLRSTGLIDTKGRK
ncbi:extracellular catalytic domain type 1 short-chain-length polyhydroxyalkanoate depolymerase [Acidisoma silvae]|uniref:PHB depolymerase family esterase n=1 Tax=Acidisoma silvae TaxID=2802396 RepID=A0A963YTV5_9PROT|nr:PHB depolymerase family esterase [Acidisoma silvae]MCB8876233.1 PHB depolymerase family esterase [Acidisoma silvae]